MTPKRRNGQLEAGRFISHRVCADQSVPRSIHFREHIQTAAKPLDARSLLPPT
jgi:hypothetical protein